VGGKTGNKKQRISIELNAPFSSDTFGIKRSFKKYLLCQKEREIIRVNYVGRCFIICALLLMALVHLSSEFQDSRKM